ncbi:MAG TPA: 4-(cytidine 5'-diphospho)-2-C-methyl-D-erythritol kinase [Actinomycetota bacterium]|nr:4-(cytidine 5'-diphospho)-2-C-methyl-D-erythritol kinase [Actinomycetota bacterium]
MSSVIGIDSRVRIRTNAKLNLFLRVVGTRPDGYHELETIFHGVGLADDIELLPTSTGGIELDMTLDPDLVGDLPTAEENLVSRSIEGLVRSGAINPGIKIHITKRIPIAAGLGGGSGNAAGALVGLSQLWNMDIDPLALHGIAMSIGSDVPYCLGGGTALAMRRGEELTPLPAPATIWFVLGISFRPLLTRDVYAAWDGMDPVDDAGSAPMTFALGAGDIQEIADLLHNDLERAAFSLWPELAGKKQAMLDAGALGAAVTGSGPTVFSIARDEAHARAIAGQVKERFDRVIVVSSHPRCVERID